MYKEKIWKSINNIEHHISFKGKYGAKGEKRGARKKKTPEEIERQNLINKRNKVRRTIQLNFFPNDLWITLNYPKGTRKPYKDVKEEFDKFARQMRKEYKIREEPLKFYYRIEIGSKGGIHIHMILNRIWGSDILVSKCWPGRSHFANLYEAGGYRKLADYLTKPLPNDSNKYKQMGLFDDMDERSMSHYGCSRNLIRPEPQEKAYKRKTVRKIIAEGPKPTQGFYIDKDSIRIGINPYTGYSYIYYTEIRIEQFKRLVRPPEEEDAGKHILRKFDTWGKGKAGQGYVFA